MTNSVVPSLGHQYRISPGLQRRCTSSTDLAVIEWFHQIGAADDEATAQTRAVGKDIIDTGGGGVSIRLSWWYWHSRDDIISTRPFSTTFFRPTELLELFSFYNVFALDLWGAIVTDGDGVVSWTGDFSPITFAGEPAELGYVAVRSKIRIMPADAITFGNARVIPRVAWIAEFTFSYDSGLNMMVLSATATFIHYVTLIDGKWHDVNGFASFSSSNRLWIMVIGETPAAWQTRTGITLVYTGGPFNIWIDDAPESIINGR